jgi:hypothetical protein
MTNRQAYVGTAQRTFAQAVVHLLETDYGLLGSRRVLELLAQDVQTLVEQFYPRPEHIPPGWMVFTGVRAEGPKARPGQPAADHTLVTLAWPVLLAEDLQALASMPSGAARQPACQALLQRRLARVVAHGCQQPDGPVLLTLADLGAMFNLSTVQVSQALQAARQSTSQSLPTKGYYFDQGSRPTHKSRVIALYEAGYDEADIARQTEHQISSVGQYIRDYERVKLLLKNHHELERIVYLTGMQPSVVQAYAGMVYQYHPDLAPEQGSLART